MLLPGPEAQQLCTWQGWVAHGYRGGLVAGWLFVSPAFFSLLWISGMYTRFAGNPWVAAAFLGAKAAVLAVVVEAGIRIGKRVLSGPASIAVAGAAFVALFALHLPFPLVVAAAGALGAALPAVFPPPAPPAARGEAGPRPLLDRVIEEGRAPHVAPKPARDLAVFLGLLAIWALPTALLAARGPSVWSELAIFFSQAAVVTFGGAYSVLAWVTEHASAQGWLTPAEMLDALSLAETTPGPLIQVVQMVGWFAGSRNPGSLSPETAGILGSVLVTWVTYWPSFALVLGGAPYVERLRQIPQLASALRAVTCAVVGVLANLSVWFTLHVWFREVADVAVGPARLPVPALASADPVAIGVALVSAVLLLGRKWPMVPVLAGAAATTLAIAGVRALAGV
jgi:chromate transporter